MKLLKKKEKNIVLQYFITVVFYVIFNAFCDWSSCTVYSVLLNNLLCRI